MKAIFEVEFDPEIMADQEQVDTMGGWLAMMQYLYTENDLGIFDNDLKLVEVKDEQAS